MNKILVIGQAPPAQKQDYPYSTTMLYDWLAEVGISKDQAQNLFEWEAVYDKFPGYDKNGGHKVPTQGQMDEHWNNVLETKVQGADKVWLMGKVASGCFDSRLKTWSCNLIVIETMHPSKRNRKIYEEDKEAVLGCIRHILNR